MLLALFGFVVHIADAAAKKPAMKKVPTAPQADKQKDGAAPYGTIPSSAQVIERIGALRTDRPGRTRFVAADAFKKVYVTILSTIDGELRKPSSSVALHPHSNAVVDVLPPEADCRIALMSAAEKPDVGYSDIGGLDRQKQEIREAVELPLTYFDPYKKIDIDPPRGVLLYGPPGSGKTIKQPVKAVANNIWEVFSRKQAFEDATGIRREAFKVLAAEPSPEERKIAKKAAFRDKLELHAGIAKTQAPNNQLAKFLVARPQYEEQKQIETPASESTPFECVRFDGADPKAPKAAHEMKFEVSHEPELRFKEKAEPTEEKTDAIQEATFALRTKPRPQNSPLLESWEVAQERDFRAPRKAATQAFDNVQAKHVLEGAREKSTQPARTRSSILHDKFRTDQEVQQAAQPHARVILDDMFASEEAAPNAALALRDREAAPKTKDVASASKETFYWVEEVGKTTAVVSRVASPAAGPRKATAPAKRPVDVFVPQPEPIYKRLVQTQPRGKFETTAMAGKKMGLTAKAGAIYGPVLQRNWSTRLQQRN